ncbi:ATP-grasp domain-containing protein [Allostreptomyces psammosilenae]|uniref:ATP-grasp domain-containing protein n=1 Tax=Allostreptomyces psammosilenae TaxID=1892865 RepID=A0A852ZXV7_9ACTN|nr:ATP-grasp domain-containing protein [Allostreptomyces psammosilenae]NYI07176.1 hypothetical protein [Allostreptomyces psammosilenae]
MVGEPLSARLEGVAHDEGAKLLRGLVDEIHWLDRSPFLSASATDPALPPIVHALTTEQLGATATRHVRARPRPRPDGRRRVGVAFAPEHGTAARAWATARRLPLLAADPAVTARAADKIDALAIFRASGVPTPEYLLVPAHGRAGAAAYWPPRWAAAVVQLRENNLTGRGTRLARDPGELQDLLDRWPGAELRVGEYVDGLPLTVSACVIGDRVVVSAVSRQLVGVPGLTEDWGAHCGNQLLGAADLPGAAYQGVRESARRVGEELRDRGYRGVFGLDLLLAADERVLAVEINPRFQTVVSLVQRAEREAGLLPTLGLHVLACLLPSVPVRTVTVALGPLSQLVTHAARAETAVALPRPGRYRLTDGGPLTGPAPVGAGLADLAPGEALVWAQSPPGGPVRPGDELLLVQLAEQVAPEGPGGARGLLPRARAWLAALSAAPPGAPGDLPSPARSPSR